MTTALRTLLAGESFVRTSEIAQALAEIPLETWGEGTDLDDTAQLLMEEEQRLGELFLSQSALVQRLIQEGRLQDADLAKCLLVAFIQEYYGEEGFLLGHRRFAPSGEVTARLSQVLRGRHWKLDQEPIAEPPRILVEAPPITVSGVVSDANTSRNVYPATPTTVRRFSKDWLLELLGYKKSIQTSPLQNIFLLTHQGPRTTQEDYGLGFEGRLPNGTPIKIAVVTDGNGSEGRKASHYTAQIFLTRLLSYLSLDPLPSLRPAIRESIRYARAQMDQRVSLSGGTTFVAFIQVGDEKIIVNLGDSRAYFLAPSGEYAQITIDHSLKGGIFFLRLLTGGALLSQGHLVIIGVRTEPDLFVPTQPMGGLLFLLSDGIDPVFAGEVGKDLSGAPLREIAETILDMMLLRGPYDNMTVGVIRVE